MIKNIQDIISKAKQYQNDVVICSYSYRTRELIEQFQINKIVNYIFDNNIRIQNTKCSGIEVIDITTLKTLVDPLVIIVGFHTEVFYSQLKKANITNILIEKQEYLTKTQQISNLLDKNFLFELEMPSNKTNINLISSKMFKKILLYLVELNINIFIKPTYANLINCKEKRDIKKNKFILSYHSFGKKDKNILRYKDGYLANMITFDKKGYSGWSSLCDININKLLKNISQKKANKYFDKLASKYIKNNKSKYTQPEQQNFSFPKEDFIFFPLQTINDTVMEHSYFKPLKFIKKIIKIISLKNIPLVIKQHPKCNNDELKNLLNKYCKKGKIILYNGSIHDAISKATTIYTINSGVGFEALLHLKPVITFGKSDYMSMSKNIDNLDKIKKEPFYYLNKSSKKQIKKFICFYIKKRSLFLDDEKGIENFIYKIIKSKMIEG